MISRLATGRVRTRCALALALGQLLIAGCLGPVTTGPMSTAPATTVRGQNALAAAPVAPPGVTPWVASVPTEKDKTTLETYIIEPPDILLIDAVKLVPKAPYHIEPLDILQLLVTGTLIEEPISGQFPVDPSGEVDLGPSYGKAHVAGLTTAEAKQAIDTHLRTILKAPQVSVSLAQSGGQQQLTGEHLVGPDGQVNMGTYGSVYVAGMTVNQAKQVIEAQLKNYLENPQVSVDVFAYNSKVYYIITEGAGLGDSLLRVPITGNETVLDALSQVNGLSRLSSKKIWIARPAPGGVTVDQQLPVNWDEITKGAATATNYQVLPGDRIFIAQNPMIALDTLTDRLTAPMQRLFGVSLLGAQGVQTFNRFPKGFGTGGAF